jgi:RNA polymerase sigma-70 factor (ECF subfamily)
MVSVSCVAPVPLMAGASRDATSHDVALAAKGDAAAFERIYRCHVGQVWSLARRLLGAANADDATQDVFLHAWRKLPQYRATGSFGAWLMTLARNQMVTRLTRAPAEPVVLEAASAPAGHTPDPADALELDAALHRLPQGARQVLVLRHFAGCTHQEIARTLGIGVGTSKSQLHRARMLLRRDLSEGKVHDD